jgi:hypothetical protein
MTREQSTPVGPAVSAADVTPSFRVDRSQQHTNAWEELLRSWPEARSQLRKAGIDRAYIEYDRQGDSWEIASVEFRDSAGQSVDLAGQVLLPVDHFRDLMRFWLEARLPDRRDDDGSYGEIEWTLGVDPLGF